VASLGGRKRTGRLFGGYGGAKGIGYLLGPIAGGALVLAGGYTLLFTVLAVLAAATAVIVAVAVPDLKPTGRQRSTVAALVGQVRRPEFWRPVLVLAAGTAALSTGVGFLPVLGARHHLGPLATGALVSLLAATAAVVQPWAGRRHDAGRLPTDATSLALAAAAAGFLVAVAFPGAAGIAAAALLIGIGVAVATPVGFANLAAGAPPDRLGRTMGAGEVGRELGDAGGPVLVGALGPIGLGAGLAALAAALAVCAGLSSPRLARLRRTPSTAEPGPARAEGQ
jgi:MFS family permease